MIGCIHVDLLGVRLSQTHQPVGRSLKIHFSVGTASLLPGNSRTDTSIDGTSSLAEESLTVLYRLLDALGLGHIGYHILDVLNGRIGQRSRGLALLCGFRSSDSVDDIQGSIELVFGGTTHLVHDLGSG